VPPVVADASPLIVFHQIDRLDLVHDILGVVLIPAAVAEEIAPSLGAPPAWIRVTPLPPGHDSFSWEASLDRGEAEAISIALSSAANQILLDNRPARRVAERLGLHVVGSLGLLLEAFRAGLIADVQPLMDAMIRVGFHVGSSLYDDVLMLADDLDRERE
jgi:predicted nucleic acid-binding protein